MDSQEPDEAQAARKVPIEKLTKEELVKKYRQAILIAQKAKETKVEIMKHFSQHEKLVQTLEERLQESENEKAKEVELRRQIEADLNAATEVIEVLKEESRCQKDLKSVENENIQQEMDKNDNHQKQPLANTDYIQLKEALESDIEKYSSENAKLISEVKVSNDRLKTLESELSQAQTNCEIINELKDQAQNLLAAKDYELKSLQETISQDKEVHENCQLELTSKLQCLEESLDNERRLRNDECLESEKKIKSIQVLLLGKDEDLKEQDKCISEMKLCLEVIQNELSDKQGLLDSSNGQIIELQGQVNDYIKMLEKKSSNDSFEMAIKNTDLMEKISKQDESLHQKEATITELLKEIQELKENQEKFKLLSSESSAKMSLLQSENSFLSEKINSLETESAEWKCLAKGKIEEIRRLEDFVSELQVLMIKLKSELSEKESLSNDKITELVAELEEYKKSVQDHSNDDAFKQLSSKNTELELEIVRRDKEIHNKEDSITDLKSKLHVVEETLDQFKLLSSESACKIDLLESDNRSYSLKLTTLNAENADLICMVNNKLEEAKNHELVVSAMESEIAKLKNEVSEKESLLKQSVETEAQLASHIKLLNLKLQESVSNHDLELLTQEKVELENSIFQKDQEILQKDEKIANFALEMKEIRHEVMALDAQKFEMTCQIEGIKKTLEERENEIIQYQTKILSSAQLEQELKEQVNFIQIMLSEKEALLQDMEQEVLKLKEAAAHESTNTEISSTFSLSRAEELSRMKDLEDSFEDKYTKLRVVAVKLKRRVTEQTQTLELERSKMAAERSDLQAKLAQLASQAKTVQSLQCEIDRLQDLLEEQKKAQQQLQKDLESAVKEAASRKFELASVQEELLCTTSQKKSLETSVSSLEFTLTQTDILQTEIDKLCKELKEKEAVLEIFKEEKQKLTEQLEKVCADAKNKSVLSLEMADMEKSVSELTRQLSLERECVKNSENELEQEHLALLTLQDNLRNLESKLEKKEIANQELKEKLVLAKEETENFQRKFKEKEATSNDLSIQLEKQRSLVEDLNIQYSDLAAKQVQSKENAKYQIESLSRQVFQLEEQCSSLRDSHKALEDELASVRTDFENYKVRAQSVLRQSAKQDERVISSSTVHNAEELEVEVERLRVNVSNLKENLKLVTSQLQAALQEVNAEREEKTRALKQAQVSKELCAQAIERQHAAEVRLSVMLEESKQTKLHSDMLAQCYKQQLEDFKTTHQRKITSLTEQLENLQASVTTPISQPAESDQVSNAQSGPSPVMEWAVHLANAANSDPDLAMRLSSLQREEGEGSESVDSFPSRRISVTTQDRRHELVPLDKLLSSPSYPDDDARDVARANSSDLNVDLLQSKLSACESRASHLTALLSEAESDAARLSQLNAVLKEEIRRQQRCEERTQHAHNLEYLKNIVVKFVTLQNGDERQRLVPVLNTILKLSPEEANLISTVVKGASQTNAASRGWGSYLPLPGWTGS